MTLDRMLGGSPARRGFLTLLLGTGFGNALALALSPVITRLFDPSNFGSFTLLTAVAMVLAPIMSLRLELAVPLPRKESASYAVVHAGIAASISLGVALSALFFFFGPVLGEALNQEAAGTWLWTTPIMASAMSSFSVLNALAVRAARYVAIARRNILMASTTLGLQIVAGTLGFGVGGLIVGFTLGQVVGAASLLFGAGLRGPDAIAGRQWRVVKDTLWHHRHVPGLLAFAGILSVLGLQAPVIVFAHYFSSEVVGWFGLTQRVLAAPITLIGLSVAHVYLSEIARTRREFTGPASRQFWKASKALFLLGALLATVLLTGGPVIFEWIFGAEWRSSGEFGRALALGLAAQLIASPLSQTLIVFERNGLQLAWDIGRLLIVTASLVAVAQVGASPVQAVWALSGSLTVLYALSWEMSRRVVTGVKTAQ